MANLAHLKRLQHGVENWNHWRDKNPRVRPNLRKANLRGANLRHVCLRDADLFGADLSGANLSDSNLRVIDLRDADLFGADLIGADLCNADLFGANLSDVNLSDTNLSGAELRGAELSNANLSSANLSEANLCGLDLRGVNLRGATLCGINLRGTNLNSIDLSGFDLSKANLGKTQALRTNFKQAILTGVCLQDWNINSATTFQDVICEYVYLKDNQQERRPRDGIYKSGEFTALFQQAANTIDLIFADGIDWQAFFHSFQELRQQYFDQDLAIQSIEKKQDSAVVVRIEASKDADALAIESGAKQLYAMKLVLMEQRYRAELQAKDGEIQAYRQQSANLMEIVKLQASRPITVEATAVADSSNRKTDLRGAQFGGGYVAGNVEGNQYGGIINNYGSNAADITRLLSALRDQAKSFPAAQKDETNDALDLLERDLADEQPDQGRIGRRLKKLIAIATTLTIGATAFTADLAQLADVLNVSLPQIEQLQPEQLPPSD